MSELAETFIDQWNASYTGILLSSPYFILALLFVLGVYFRSEKSRPDEPPRAKYTIPFVGNGIEFLREPEALFSRCREKRINLWPWITIFDRTELWSEYFSFDNALADLMDTTYVFGDTQPNNRFHIEIMRKNLARQLNNSLRVCAAYTAKIGDAKKPYQMDDCGAFIEDMKIYKNNEILSMMKTVSRDVERTTLFKRVFPLFISRMITQLISDVNKNINIADNMIAPEVIKRRQLSETLRDDYAPPHDMLSWMIDVNDSDGALYDPITVARRALQMGFSSVASTSAFAIHAMFDIAGRSEYYEKVRRLVRRYGNDITPEALQEMYFMDACIRESLRLNGNPALTTRKAMVDVKLTNGYCIPEGRMCFFQGQEIHLAEDLYGSNSRTFNPYHHYRRDTSISTKPTTSNNAFVAFGTGPHMCPGRFLAIMCIKVIVAYGLRHYDFRTMSGKRPGNSIRDGFTSLPFQNQLS
ncbi:cytochrome P450 [Syncephalis plumigaleata]|nr:cytochrome P450 [Syncephalis plumigaleata]